jgi:hypothetical protein
MLTGRRFTDTQQTRRAPTPEEGRNQIKILLRQTRAAAARGGTSGSPKPLAQPASPGSEGAGNREGPTKRSACQSMGAEQAGALEHPTSQAERPRANRINGPANRPGRQQQGR